MAMTPEEEAEVRRKLLAEQEAQRRAKAAEDAEAEEKRNRQNMFWRFLGGIWDNIGTIILAAIFLPVIYNLIQNPKVQEQLGGLVNWFCEFVGIENVNGVQMVQGWVRKLDVLANENLPAGFVREDAMGKLLDFYKDVKNAKKEFEGEMPPAILNAIMKDQATWDAFRQTVRQANGGKTNTRADLTNDKVIFALLTQQPSIVRDILTKLKTGADGKPTPMPPEITEALRAIINDEARFKILLTGPQLDMTIEALKALNPSLEKKGPVLKKIIAEALAKNNITGLRELFDAALTGNEDKIKAAFDKLGVSPASVIALADPKANGPDGKPRTPAQQNAIAALQTPNGQNAIDALDAKLGPNNKLLLQALTAQEDTVRTAAFLAIARTPGVLPQAVNLAAQLPPETLAEFKIAIDMRKLNSFIQTVDANNAGTQQLFAAIQNALPTPAKPAFNLEPIIPAFIAMSISPQLLTGPKAQQAQKALADLLGSIPNDSVKGENARASFKQAKALLIEHREQTFALLRDMGEKAPAFVRALMSTDSKAAVASFMLKSENIVFLQRIHDLQKAIAQNEQNPLFDSFVSLTRTLGTNPDGQPNDAMKTLLQAVPANATGMDTIAAAITPAFPAFIASAEVLERLNNSTTKEAARKALREFVANIPESPAPIKDLLANYSEQTFDYLTALGPDGVKELFAAMNGANNGAMLHVALKYSAATKKFAEIDPEKLRDGSLKTALITIRGIDPRTFDIYASIDRKTGDIALVQADIGKTDAQGNFTIDASKVAGCVFEKPDCQTRLGKITPEIAALITPEMLSLNATPATPEQVTAVEANITKFLAFAQALGKINTSSDPAIQARNKTVMAALEAAFVNHDPKLFRELTSSDLHAFFANEEVKTAFTTFLSGMDTNGLPPHIAQLHTRLQQKYADGRTGLDQVMQLLTTQTGTKFVVEEHTDAGAWAQIKLNGFGNKILYNNQDGLAILGALAAAPATANATTLSPLNLLASPASAATIR